MLSTETLLEILRHFTRKELSQIFYLVNRQFHQLATSRKHVPAIHNIQEILFSSPNHIQRGRPNTITIASPFSEDGYFETFSIDQLPVPGPFIRFGQVSIYRRQPDIMLRFMEEVKESFIGCKLHIPMEIGVSHDLEQMHYLLQNVFSSPISVKISDKNWLTDPNLFLQTKGMLKCKRLELHWYNKFVSFADTQKALLNWLRTDSELRHLILVHYPRQIILGIMQQVKEEFGYNITMPLNFVVTFSESTEDRHCSEGEDLEFTLDDKPTGQRLSLFKHHEVVGQISDRAYRLWHRRVDNETSDASVLSCLQNQIESGPVAEFDSEFYSFDYPIYYDLE
ncbi:hypothetical protein DdX_12937 [Ditylenchus destructor]|uniref:F-box domain-containing protein n=1 Tax=Ditylenchus destructor TaxID=166010 RepID=A0AAD4MW21_9BILA|nr:hypothetical protein DdX_12937 [Ditylenchus destructor]